MVIFGCPGACVSLVPALCYARSFDGEVVSSPGRSQICSGHLAFVFRGCGLARAYPGTGASRLAHGCGLGACDPRSA